MVRKLLFPVLLLVLACLTATALAQSAYPQGEVTLQELQQWGETLKERALTLPPLNDPSDPEALTEDGYAFVYEFITLYLDTPELTADSVVRGMVLTAGEEIGPRGMQIDMDASEVLSRFPNGNPNLEGTKDAAALYVTDQLPVSASWGSVQRDGQRLGIIQYTIHHQLDGDTYTDAGLVFTIQANGVGAIRAYGLDQTAELADVRIDLQAMNLLKVQKAYRQITAEADGSAAPFQMADLTFGGVDLLGLTPEKAAQIWGDGAEETILEEGNGRKLRTMEFEAVTVTFQYDGVDAFPRLKMFTIDMDGAEGPRALRVGDLISEVIPRFRSGEGAFDEATGRTVFYGTPGEAPYGFALYQNDASAVLWYALKTPTGATVTMRLDFQQLQLHELTIQAE